MKRLIIPATLIAGAGIFGGLGLTAGATAPVVHQPTTPIVNIPSAPKAPVVTVAPSAPAVPPTGTLSSGSTNTVTQSAPTGSSVTSTVHADSTTDTTPAPAAPAPEVAASDVPAAPDTTTTTTAPPLLTGTDYSVTWYGSQTNPTTGVLTPINGGYEGSQMGCMAVAANEAAQGMQVGGCAPHTFTYTGP